MRLPRPSTLWRALAGELWRLLAISAAVVVVVGIFAVTLRPLADGRIGPAEAVKFMLLGALPMLQYALPFAAGFAATLAYHRLATDNELVAAHAGGISHRAMLAPAAATGLALAAALLVLSDTVIPRLLRGMEQILTQDLVRLVIAPIKRGEAIQFGPRIQIYADDIATPAPTEGEGIERYLLSGAMVVEFDEQGAVVAEGSARTAYLWVHRRDTPDAAGWSGTTAVVRLDEATIIDPSRAQEVEQTTFSRRLPGFFNDDPKFHSWRELERIREKPEMMNFVERRRETLASLLAERTLVTELSRELADRGTIRFADLDNREVTLRAARMGAVTPGRGWPLEPVPGRGAGVLEVSVVTGEGRARLYRPARAWIAESGESGPPGTLDLRMENVETGSVGVDASGQVVTAMDPAATKRREIVMPGLRPMGLRFDESTRPARELLAQARGEAGAPGTGGSRVEKAAAALGAAIASLEREILSKQHERLAAAAACLIMVLCGSIMAMRLRDSLPLTVYLWSFLPGLGALLTISGGQRMTHQSGPIGLVVLWGGVGGLAIYTLLEYRKLTRH